MDIKVLGSGCANCKTTYALIEAVAREKGRAVHLAKVEELRDIMAYGVMSTPGVVIDGKVVHAGGVPGRDKVEHWLSGDTCCGGDTGGCGCSGSKGASKGGCC